MAMAKLFTYILYEAPGTILALVQVDTKVLLVWRKGCQKEATKETGSQSERWLGLNLGATFSEFLVTRHSFSSTQLGSGHIPVLRLAIMGGAGAEKVLKLKISFVEGTLVGR